MSDTIEILASLLPMITEGSFDLESNSNVYKFSVPPRSGVTVAFGVDLGAGFSHDYQIKKIFNKAGLSELGEFFENKKTAQVIGPEAKPIGAAATKKFGKLTLQQVLDLTYVMWDMKTMAAEQTMQETKIPDVGNLLKIIYEPYKPALIKARYGSNGSFSRLLEKIDKNRLKQIETNTNLTTTQKYIQQGDVLIDAMLKADKTKNKTGKPFMLNQKRGNIVYIQKIQDALTAGKTITVSEEPLNVQKLTTDKAIQELSTVLRKAKNDALHAQKALMAKKIIAALKNRTKEEALERLSGKYKEMAQRIFNGQTKEKALSTLKKKARKKMNTRAILMIKETQKFLGLDETGKWDENQEKALFEKFNADPKIPETVREAIKKVVDARKSFDAPLNDLHRWLIRRDHIKLDEFEAKVFAVSKEDFRHLYDVTAEIYSAFPLDIKKVQTFLTTKETPKGSPYYNGTPSDKWDKKSIAALKALLKDMGVNSNIDPSNNKGAARISRALNQAGFLEKSVASIPDAPSGLTEEYKKIRDVELELLRKGFYKKKKGVYDVGVWDDKTKEALNAFQKANDLPLSNEINEETLNALLPDFQPLSVTFKQEKDLSSDLSLIQKTDQLLNHALQELNAELTSEALKSVFDKALTTFEGLYPKDSESEDFKYIQKQQNIFEQAFEKKKLIVEVITPTAKALCPKFLSQVFDLAKLLTQKYQLLQQVEKDTSQEEADLKKLLDGIETLKD